MGGKKVASGAQKRKKKREKEKLAAEMERLKLGPTELWNGLVLHHRCVCLACLVELNTTDRFFFSEVNRESWGVLEYAGVNVSGNQVGMFELTSISTLEWAWNNIRWGREKYKWKSERSSVVLHGSCWNEQTRVSQVGERSETLRVG